MSTNETNLGDRTMVDIGTTGAPRSIELADTVAIGMIGAPRSIDLADTVAIGMLGEPRSMIVGATDVDTRERSINADAVAIAATGLDAVAGAASGLDALVQAVLYEGYALYPYRPSALKNQRRFAFGAIYPRAWAERTLDPHLLRTEVLVEASANRSTRHGALTNAALGSSDGAPTSAAVGALDGESPELRACVRFLRLSRGGGGREHRIELLPIRLHAGVSEAIETRTECFLPATDELPALEIEVETTVTEIETTATATTAGPTRAVTAAQVETTATATTAGPTRAVTAAEVVSTAGPISVTAAEVETTAGPISVTAAEVETTAGPMVAEVHRGLTRLWRFAIEVRNVSEIVSPASAVVSQTSAHELADEPVVPQASAHEIAHEAAMDVSPASTHVVLRVTGGQFVSAIDPPAEMRAASAACRSTGLFPILAGEGAMLCSPIILPDYPEIAPQSPGDFFDGTEMDEMLTLRVLTMTDDEKREAAAADPRIAALIARTEALGIEQTARLHGVVRGASSIGPRVSASSIGPHVSASSIGPHVSASSIGPDVSASSGSIAPQVGVRGWLGLGTRVRLRPSRRADAFDIILAGKLGTVAAVERDIDGGVHCAVTLDDDPGADLGVAGMPGHRFYFRADELEVLA